MRADLSQSHSCASGLLSTHSHADQSKGLIIPLEDIAKDPKEGNQSTKKLQLLAVGPSTCLHTLKAPENTMDPDKVSQKKTG
jgi:hypothetical protein